ncbi:MAG: lamin tail domain-containing protein, partial [Sedimentisphaerales bacterium]|nr:lamin tail domain-containing protein [Sedimentisphaerales bacterium]
MRTKLFPIMVLTLCVMGGISRVRALPLITKVDRTDGTTGNRAPIGAFNSETDPLPSEGGLANGLYCFSDRTYTWTNMVPQMAGQEYVRTFNTDKGDTDADVIYRVTISGPGMFWIAMDDRFPGIQSLVDQTVADFASPGTFTDTGYNLFIGGDSDRPMSVFKSSATSPAGTYNFRYSAYTNNYYTIGIDAPAGNQPPDVDAGNDTEITMPARSVVLDGTVTDDGLGNPAGYLARQWSRFSGPGQVEFQPSATIDDPTAIFEMNKYGVYVLKLYATDGELDDFDTVTITVNEPDCPVGDMNGDCLIDQQDFCLFALEWLTNPGGLADFSGDNYVDFSDYKWLAENWLVNNQSGSLQVTIYPEDVRGIGAYWRVNGGLWRNTGDIEDALPIGTSTVEFSELDDWNKPADQQVEILYGPLNQASGTYQPHTGSLRVNISPPDVLPDAKWRRLGQTTWRDSGSTESSVQVGPHIVEFNPVAGWLTPAAREVVIAQDTLYTLAAEYTDLGDLTLRINEFMAANSSETGIMDEYGEPDDWIEIYNATDFDVDMAGMYIADDQEIWRIPAGYPTQTTVRAKGYIVFWADNEEETEGPLHLPFKLGVGGDSITIYDTDATTIIDSITFGSQIWNVSYGRYPDAANDWYFFDDPSAGEENDHAGVANRVADTSLYPDRGFYDTPFEVTIETNTPGATIYFTTDSSDPIVDDSPTASAQIYSLSNKPYIATTTCLRAAAVKAGCLSTNIDTHTYIFLNDVLEQATNPSTGAQVVPAGYPTQWISPATVTGDYQVDPDIVNHANPSDRLTVSDLRAAPTIVMTMNIDRWFSPSIGIYVNESLSKSGKEYPCSFEYFDPDGSGKNVQQNCAVAMAGGVSGGGTSLDRWKTFKLSMRPRFKTQTDDGTSTGGGTKLSERIFPDSPVNDFDSIVLDAVLNHSWLHSAQHTEARYVQDQATSDFHNAMMPNHSPHGAYAHVYINNLYWGMYYIHERPDHSWAAETFGGNKDEYDAIKHSASTVINSAVGGPGATASFNAMSAAASAAGSDPTNLTKWQTLEAQLDVDNVITYLLSEWFAANHDWPSKNWYATHKVGGQWRFHTWDAEHTFEGGNDVGESPTGIHDKLKNNVEYKMRWADLIHKNFHHGGPLSYPRSNEIYQFRVTQANEAIRGESGRWGDNRSATPHTRSQWLAISPQNGGYFPTRSDAVFGYLSSAGLYPTTEPPDFEVNGTPIYGGYVSLGDELTITNPNSGGTRYYTTNGNDPRLPGGAVNSAGGAIAYNKAITIEHTIHLKSRVLRSGEWSALSEAVYAVPTVAENLRITEIMYHAADPPEPSDYNDGDFEYIELQNTGAESVNLNLVRFTNGVEFTFDASVLLSPNEYVLVVKNQAAFATRYPVFSGLIAGEYSGSLDNGGEEIDLKDALDAEIHDFDYDDKWRPHTDGDGFSLTIIDPLNPDPNTWDEKDSWRASVYIGGSPGWDDSGILPNPGAIAINEVMAHSHAEASDWIELYNTTDEEIDIA